MTYDRGEGFSLSTAVVGENDKFVGYIRNLSDTNTDAIVKNTTLIVG